MSVKTPLIRNLPTYSQHPNGCGLSALLMLINVQKDKEVEQFLTKVWNKVKLLFLKNTYEQKELQWALALQYILLKSIGYSLDSDKQPIYEFFQERLNYTYEDIRIMNTFNQEQLHKMYLNKGLVEEGYLFLHYTHDNDYITPPVLMENLHTMKTDLELKILGELFNYQFIYQHSEDMTGAVYFTKKELKKNISQNSKVKWNKLEHWANDPDLIILYGQYYHWLSIRGMYRTFQLKKDQLNSFPKELEKKLSIPESSKSEKSDISSSNDNKSVLQEIESIFDDEIEENEDWKYDSMILDINDPAITQRILLNFGQLSESDRFYIFQRRPDTDYKIFDTFLALLDKEIPIELNLWKEHIQNKDKSKGSKDSGKKEPIDPLPTQTKIDKQLSKKQVETELKVTELEQKLNYLEKIEKHGQNQATGDFSSASMNNRNERKLDKPGGKENEKSKKSPLKQSEPPKFWEMMDDE